MLVMKIFEDEESSDVVDESVLGSGVEVNCVLVLAVVPDGVLQLQNFSRLVRAL